MEHSDKEQSEISRNTSPLSSKTIAMGLPEILHNVFSFLEQRTLIRCLQVSRFWYTHGRTLAWQTFSIDIVLFSSFAYDIYDVPAVETDKYRKDQKDKEKDKDKLQDFIENCHHIRSLTLTRPSRSLILKIADALHPRVAGLKNLNHLALKTNPPPESYAYHLAGAILSQNPRIQEIVWDFNWFCYNHFRDFVLKRVVGGKLKKLTIDTRFRTSEMRCLEYLIDANKKRQEQKQQEGPTITTQGALMGDSVKNENKSSGSGSGSDHGFELEELVLRGNCRDSKADWEWLNDYVGELPIRTLRVINFEPFERYPRDYDDDDEDDEEDEDEDNSLGNSILPILSKCPDLEKLCVSFDLHPVVPDTLSRTFLNNLERNPHYSSQPYTKIIDDNEGDFVEQMHEYCPKLREIEFGMCYHLTSDHWIQMMEIYGPRLESLSIWGNVPEFNSEAFMTLIGLPISEFRRDGLHTLTRLNINGMRHLDECAYMALYLLPHLKEFRARDVPLDAKSLTEEEWTCQGLEVLEMHVAIPKRTRWQWDNGHGWGDGYERYRSDIEADREDACNKDDEDDEELKTLKRRVKYLSTEGPRKKAREDSMKYINTQVKVCKALGRLTQLKELRIEGGGYYMHDGSREWNCLELTLETGLEHLAPLRHSLERLTVSGLDEGLSGRKEVEWIACNWIHHNNSPWLEQHHSSQKSMGLPEGSTAASVRPDDGASFDTRSRFKALIGISVEAEDAKSNIKWLRDQCPTLSVIEVTY